jgi:hypothetical protein
MLDSNMELVFWRGELNGRGSNVIARGITHS